MSLQKEADRQDKEQINYESDYYPIIFALLGRMNKYIRSTIRDFGISHVNINNYRDDFNKVLKNIYSRVQDNSIDKLYNFTTKQDITDSNKQKILLSMSGDNIKNISDNLFYILSTSRKELNKFYNDFNNIETDQEIHNYIYDKLENVKNMRSRVIAHRNVGLSYESLKNSIASNHSRDTGRVAKKIWITMGDDKVRMSHREANRQEVPFNALYIVQNQLLKYPKDMNHGATLDNVMECRCVSIIIF